MRGKNIQKLIILHFETLYNLWLLFNNTYYWAEIELDTDSLKQCSTVKLRNNLQTTIVFFLHDKLVESYEACGL